MSASEDFIVALERMLEEVLFGVKKIDSCRPGLSSMMLWCNERDGQSRPGKNGRPIKERSK